MNRMYIEELYKKSRDECIQNIKISPTCEEYAKKTVVERVIKGDLIKEKEFEGKIKEYLEKGFTVERAISRAIDYMWEKILTSSMYTGTSDWEFSGMASKIQSCMAQGYYPKVCEEIERGRYYKTNVSWYY